MQKWRQNWIWVPGVLILRVTGRKREGARINEARDNRRSKARNGRHRREQRQRWVARSAERRERERRVE